MLESSDAANLPQRVIIRHVQLDDLVSLEWGGEFRHYRRLYREIYAGVERGEAIMWLAELPETGIIGQLFVQFRSNRPELADGNRRAYIYGFRIKPAYRGLGLGTQMLAIAEEDLDQRGFERVVLNVSQDNSSALILYQRLGYEVVSNEPGRWSYIDDLGVQRWVEEPAWRMEKTLPRAHLAS